MDYEFPFDVPEDVSTLNRAQIDELYTTVRDHGQALRADENATPEALNATAELFGQVKERRDAFIAAEQNAEAFDVEDEPGDTDDDADDADTDTDDSDAGVAGVSGGDDATLTANEGRGTPTLRKVKGRTPKASTQTPSSIDTAYATMHVATDVPNKTSGAKLSSFSEAAEAVSERIGQYSAPDRLPPNRQHRRGQRKAARTKRNNVTHSTTERAEIMVQHPDGHAHTLKNYARHGAVRFRRDYPTDQRLLVDDEPYDKVLQVSDERRLPGGTLARSATDLVQNQGKSLTAAVGWCAPSENLYQLCELESMDGILDLPEMQADRGGFNIPEDGGIDFSTIWNGIGSGGDTHLSEYDIESDTGKVCWEIPCPDFVDTRLGVDYVCLTAGLLQRAGYPEVIRRVSRGSMVALAHKINQGVISDMVTAAGASTTIPADPGGDDAAAALLSSIELGIVDTKYRQRMPFNTTLEVMLPMWALAVIRAALSRRSGVALLGVTDAQILEWFTIRGAVPRFVYDWQDALSGLAGGPGGATALDSFPTTMDTLIYPAGTFTKAVQPVVSLDTIYDSSGLQQNQYTALFAEDGWAVLQTCPEARQYTIPVDVSGCVGCIADGTS